MSFSSANRTAFQMALTIPFFHTTMITYGRKIQHQATRLLFGSLGGIVRNEGTLDSRPRRQDLDRHTAAVVYDFLRSVSLNSYRLTALPPPAAAALLLPVQDESHS